MKRYIRTKDGIYEVNELNEYATHHKRSKTLIVIGKYILNVLNDSIINQASTIEELCDEFVVVEKDNNQHKVFNKKDSDVFFIKNDHIDYFIKYNDFYGAIWTSKGLIYVAKMNDKGELELI